MLYPFVLMCLVNSGNLKNLTFLHVTKLEIVKSYKLFRALSSLVLSLNGKEKKKVASLLCLKNILVGGIGRDTFILPKPYTLPLFVLTNVFIYLFIFPVEKDFIDR